MDDDAQIQYLSLRLGPRNLHLAWRKKEAGRTETLKSHTKSRAQLSKCKYISSVTDYFMEAYPSDNLQLHAVDGPQVGRGGQRGERERDGSDIGVGMDVHVKERDP